MKAWSKINGACGRLSNWFAVACAAACLINMAIIFANVFMRLLFNHPLAGVTEYATIILMFVAYFGVAYTLLKGRHMQMSALYDRYKPKMREVMNCAINLVIVFVFIILTVTAYRGLVNSIATREVMQASITVYRWPGRLAITLGCAMVVVDGAVRLINSILAVAGKKVEIKENGGEESV